MPVFSDYRTVQKFGASKAITIPANFARNNQIELGQKLKILYNLEGLLIAYTSEAPEILLRQLANLIQSLGIRGAIIRGRT